MTGLPLGWAADAGAEAHVLVDDLAAPVLRDEDRHHLERVRRLRPGAAITIADGAGRWRTAALARVPEPTGPIHAEPEPVVRVAIGFAPVKGDRPEWVVQKLTELGVDEIVVLECDRSVVRWDGGRAAANMERLGRVVREAAMQCRRSRLPSLVGPLARSRWVEVGPLVRADRGGAALGVSRTVLVGPEGGWSPEESQAVPDSVGVGDLVLRAETAAVAVAAIVTHARRA